MFDSKEYRQFWKVVGWATSVSFPILAVCQTRKLSTAKAAQRVDDYEGILHPGVDPPSFEVASIRRSAPNPELRFSGVTMKSDRLEIRGSSIQDVVRFAYNLASERELSGGPAWVRTEKFDITGKPDDTSASLLSSLAPADLHVRMRLMLQVLLKERLRLKVSFPLKDRPVFVVVLAKEGLKCTNATPEGVEGPISPPPPAGGYLSTQPGQEMHWQAQSLPIRLILGWFREQPEMEGRTLIDKTGLNGRYNCNVSWAREGTDTPGASFFTAVQKQMGIKLLPARSQTETLSIDFIEQPSEN